MTTKRDPWVRVKSENELRAGVFRLSPCIWCHRHCLRILARKVPSPCLLVVIPGGEFRTSPAVEAWEFTGSCRPVPARLFDPTFPIREGRLFRLADDQLADLSETRDLESVR